MYKSIIVNSNRHIAIANLLYDKEEFGTAISHLVLGAEEMVKALIIFLEGQGLNLRAVRGVKLFFSDHKTRHTLSQFYSWMIITIKKTLDLRDLFKQAVEQKKEGYNLQGLNKAIVEDDHVKIDQFAKIWAQRQGRELFETIFQQIDFWEEADEYKMRGFYVDYSDVLKTPEQITDIKFNIALDSVSTFINECKRAIGLITEFSEDEKIAFANSFNQHKEFKDLITGVIYQGWGYFEKKQISRQDHE